MLLTCLRRYSRYINCIGTGRGGSRIFLRRGCTSRIFLKGGGSCSVFLQNISCIRKPPGHLGGGGGRGHTPCTLPHRSTPGECATMKGMVFKQLSLGKVKESKSFSPEYLVYH